MLHKVAAFRKIFLPILQKYSFDFSIAHPWIAGNRILLNSFKHKGYWYYRKAREKNTMLLFGLLIDPGNTVVEVGGHIGFISLWFLELVGTQGRVIVYEPGSNNLPYIERNLAGIKNVSLIKKAAGKNVGEIELFEDNLTGQNNSIISNFSILRENASNAYVDHEVISNKVSLTTIDKEVSDLGSQIDFIKIDVEGGEWDVLLGAIDTIKRDLPIVMVEVQVSHEGIFNYFSQMGYLLFDDMGNQVTSWQSLKSNTFCLHSAKHREKFSCLSKIKSSQ